MLLVTDNMISDLLTYILGDSSAPLCAVEGTADWHPHLESSVSWIVFKGHIFSPFQVLIVSSRVAV